MTTTEWRRVRDLFEQALDREGSGVDAWLAREAEGEPAVAAEVRALLVEHGRVGAFLEAPAAGRVAHLFDEDPRFDEGQVVGPYKIASEIGRGGMGRVYGAVDTRLGRAVALKVLPPALAGDPRERERLRREARAAASLTHPGICTVFALEEIEGEVFIVSELVNGETLRTLIERGPTPSPAELMETARQVAAALGSAHDAGVTHRDLKPENVMRTRDGRLKILDFGLAVAGPRIGGGEGEPRLTLPGGLVGTPAYMAPEQLNGKPTDVRTDVFAYGVVLHEYATGVHPFAAETPLAQAASVLHGEPRPLRELRPDVPLPLALALERCLRKLPGERFSSAGEVSRALGSAAVSRQPGDTAQWWRGHQLAAIALYAVAAIAAWMLKEQSHGVADTGFVLAGVAAMTAGVFRGHLLFAEQMNRASFRAERRRAAPVTLAADLVIALVLAVEGWQLTSTRPVAGLLTIALAVGIGLSRVLIEPATTVGAFGDPR